MTSSLPDDGSGTVQVWRVEDFKLEPVTTNGVFYSGDCYVILYTYLKNSRERHIIYFWLVSHLNIQTELTKINALVCSPEVGQGNNLHRKQCFE